MKYRMLLALFRFSLWLERRAWRLRDWSQRKKIEMMPGGTQAW